MQLNLEIEEYGDDKNESLMLAFARARGCISDKRPGRKGPKSLEPAKTRRAED